MTAAVDKQSLDHFFIGIQSASSLDTQNDGLSAVNLKVVQNRHDTQVKMTF